MTSTNHAVLTGLELHAPFQYIQEMDPGAVGGGLYWLKVSTGEIKRRKDDDSGWDPVGGGSGFIPATIFAAKGDILGASANDTPAILSVGANGKFLVADSAETTGLNWATHNSTGDPHTQYTTDAEATTIADAESAAAVSTHVGLSDPHAQYLKESVLTAKGDLYVATGSGVVVRLAVGSNGNVLTADSGETDGVKWAAGGGGGGGGGEIGAWASLPAPGTAGAIYFPTDASVIAIDDGTAWQIYGPAHPLHMDGAPTSDFNKGSSTIDHDGWSIYIESANTGSTGTYDVKGVEKTYPATPFMVDIGLVINATNRQYIGFGFMARDSASGRIVTFGPLGATGIYIQRFTSATAFGGNDENTEFWLIPQSIFWIRFEDDGTNIVFSLSADGTRFIPFATHTRTYWLASPDKIGFFLNNQANLYRAGLTLVSWYEH